MSSTTRLPLLLQDLTAELARSSPDDPGVVVIVLEPDTFDRVHRDLANYYGGKGSFLVSGDVSGSMKMICSGVVIRRGA